MGAKPAGQPYRPKPDQEELTRKIHASEARKADERSRTERTDEAISWLNGDEFEPEEETNDRHARLMAATEWLGGDGTGDDRDG
jgi:hypothetical protein